MNPLPKQIKVEFTLNQPHHILGALKLAEMNGQTVSLAAQLEMVSAFHKLSFTPKDWQTCENLARSNENGEKAPSIHPAKKQKRILINSDDADWLLREAEKEGCTLGEIASRLLRKHTARC